MSAFLIFTALALQNSFFKISNYTATNTASHLKTLGSFSPQPQILGARITNVIQLHS